MPGTRCSSSARPSRLALTFFGSSDSNALYSDAIVPAAALGVLGLVAMAGQTRAASTLNRSAGAPPVPERVQTAALALAGLLPFAVGLVWFASTAYKAAQHPPPPGGFPFGDVSGSWKLAILFGEGAMSTLGGPLLGVLIGRWWPRRGVAPITAVLLVAAVHLDARAVRAAAVRARSSCRSPTGAVRSPRE